MEVGMCIVVWSHIRQIPLHILNYRVHHVSPTSGVSYMVTRLLHQTTFCNRYQLPYYWVMMSCPGYPDCRVLHLSWHVWWFPWLLVHDFTIEEHVWCVLILKWFIRAVFNSFVDFYFYVSASPIKSKSIVAHNEWW